MALLTGTGVRIIRYCSMADVLFFKMAAVRHLGFPKVGNFNCPYPSEGQSASSCQISRRSVKPFRIYGLFSIFQDGGHGYVGFWKFQIFNRWHAQEGQTASACQILSKSIKPRLRYGDFSIFQDGGRLLLWPATFTTHCTDRHVHDSSSAISARRHFYLPLRTIRYDTVSLRALKSWRDGHIAVISEYVSKFGWDPFSDFRGVKNEKRKI